MTVPTPEIHATLLAASAVGALGFGGLILARNPPSVAARLHAGYAAAIAWWFTCLAIVATADTPERVHFWSRALHLSLAMLPGVVYHLNIALAGLTAEYRRRIQIHWIVSALATIWALTWPTLFGPPHSYAWGMYPSYTLWGIVPVALLLGAVVEVQIAYRVAMKRNPPGSARHQRAQAFFKGNLFTLSALLDFLPAFGVPWYPFGFAVMSVMHAVTAYGSIRYRLIEITPEFAAEFILGAMPDGLLVIDTQDVVRLANPPTAELLGVSIEDLVDHPISAVGGHAEVVAALQSPEGKDGTTEVRTIDGSGRERFLRLSRATVCEPEGLRVGEVWVLHDQTPQRTAEHERGQLEASVRQTQKLETLGVMAGRLAHDFNNLLVAILGHAELADVKAGGNDAVRAHLHRIAAAAEQASELTNQMLTYITKRPTYDTLVSLNGLVDEMVDLMSAAISRNAELNVSLGEHLPLVFGDDNQIRQVILNLITNASDALEGTAGSITLRTGVLRPDESFRAAGDGTVAGPTTDSYVFLEVTDTGVGMDEETQGKMFDPFFTTKLAGRGLGLATLRGIVRGHRGLIRVRSAPGSGTVFTVALPRAAAAAAPDGLTELVVDRWTSSGFALLADDEDEVRAVASSMLSGAGFNVIEVRDGREAVDAFRAHESDISVVVLDKTMPHMSGTEAFSEIRSLSTEVPIVFMSGYLEAQDSSKAEDGHTAILSKPFRAAALAAKVREAMGTPLT